MPEKLVRTLRGRILGGEKDCLIVRRPSHVSDAFECLRQNLAGAQIFEMKFELPVTGRITCISENISVVARHKCLNAIETKSLRKLVKIQQHFFFAIQLAL